MRINNLFMIIGIIIFMAVYIAQGALQITNSIVRLASLADTLLTPISWVGIIFFVVGLNGLRKISVSQEIYTKLSNREKKELRYFGATFLLTFALFGLAKTYNTIAWILTPIAILTMLAYLFLAYKSTAIIKKYGRTKVYPITWLLLLFVPIANIITSIIIWRKNTSLLKNNQ